MITPTGQPAINDIPVQAIGHLTGDQRRPQLKEFDFQDEQARRDEATLWLTRAASTQMREEKMKYYARVHESKSVYRSEKQGEAKDIPVHINKHKAIVKTMLAHYCPHPIEPNVTPKVTSDDDHNKALNQLANIDQKMLEWMIDCSNLDQVIRRAVKEYLLTGRGLIRTHFKRYEDGRPPKVWWESVPYNCWYAPEVEFLQHARWIIQKRRVSKDDASSYFNANLLGEGPAMFKDNRQKTMPGTEVTDDVTQFGNTDYFEFLECFDEQNRSITVVDVKRRIVIDRYQDPWNLKNFYPFSTPLIPDPHYGMTPEVPWTTYADLHHQANVAYEKNARSREGMEANKLAGEAVTEPIEDLITASTPIFVEVPGLSQMMTATNKGAADLFYRWDTVPDQMQMKFFSEDVFELLRQIDDISGISDIMRGSTMKEETAAAQKLKSDYNSIRTTTVRDQVKLMVRDSLQNACHFIPFIAREHPQLIAQVSGHIFKQGDDTDNRIIQMLLDTNEYAINVDVTSRSLTASFTNEEMQRMGMVYQILDRMEAKLMEADGDIQRQIAIIREARDIINAIRIDPDTNKNINSSLTSRLEPLETEWEQMQQPGYAEAKMAQEAQMAQEMAAQDPGYQLELAKANSPISVAQINQQTKFAEINANMADNRQKNAIAISGQQQEFQIGMAGLQLQRADSMGKLRIDARRLANEIYKARTERQNSQAEIEVEREKIAWQKSRGQDTPPTDVSIEGT